MLRGGDGTWTERDRQISVALTLHEQGLCSGCGHPVSRTHDVYTAGRWQAESSVCQGCEAKERRQDAIKRPQPGTKVYVRFDDD